MTDPITRLNAALEGRYRVERELGEGGMATVYLAEDLRHERKVALKVLKPELAAVVGAERFLAEIKTTANLQHPHILPLFDSGEADGFLFYVMPYVEGESLREKLDREHQLPVDEAVQIATNVAEALDHAHRHGVIHRDVKPANILLGDGKPIVSDFGIALAVGVAGGGRLTETGLSLGTPHYMSPEQATGELSVGPATDIYALGCVLYEILVGEPPHTGSTAQAILGKIIQAAPVSATAVRASVLANVDAAIRKALEKLPADRFTGAQDFARALGDEGFRHGELAGVAAGAVPGPWNRLTVTMTALFALSSLTLGWSLLRPEPPAPVARFSLLFEEGQAPIGALGGVELTADGSALVYVGPGAGVGSQLWIRRWENLDATPIAGTEGTAVLASYSSGYLSPDERELAFHVGSPGPLRVVALEGGLTRTLAESAHAATEWTADGTVYFVNAAAGISRVPDTGGAAEIVTELAEGETIHYFFRLLPSEEAAVFQVWHARSGEDAEIWAIDLETGERRPLTPGNSPRYAATGHLLFGTPDGTLMAAPIDEATAELTGPAVPVAEGLATDPTFGVLNYSVSEEGSLVYLAGLGLGGGLQQLVVVDLEGNDEPLALAPRAIPNLGVGWSPDGESVVFSSEDQIYTYNVTLGSTPRQLTFGGRNIRAIFSPDGNRVAFSSTRQGTDGLDLFVKDLNDNSPPRSIITLEANQWVVQWPSDTLIVFERGQVGVSDLWMVNMSDPDNPIAEAYLSSEADLQRISISPDGTLAAYRSDESGIDEIYIRSFPDPGVQTVVSQGGGGVPFWSPDGNTLYYAVLGGEIVAARLQRDPVPVVLSRESLFNRSLGGPEPFPGSALHPDGDRFIFAQSVGTGAEDAGAEPVRLILVQNFFEELRQVVPD